MDGLALVDERRVARDHEDPRSLDIAAATVNGADWRVRDGGYGTALKFPYVLGRDFSGTVSALGEGVTDFQIGDEVFAVLPPGQEGTYAEKVAIKAEVVAKKPAGLSQSSTPQPSRSPASPRST